MCRRLLYKFCHCSAPPRPRGACATLASVGRALHTAQRPAGAAYVARRPYCHVCWLRYSHHARITLRSHIHYRVPLWSGIPAPLQAPRPHQRSVLSGAVGRQVSAHPPASCGSPMSDRVPGLPASLGTPALSPHFASTAHGCVLGLYVWLLCRLRRVVLVAACLII